MARCWADAVAGLAAAAFICLTSCEEIEQMIMEQAVHADYFVATNGNDAWSGTLAKPNKDKSDGPFATITAARDAIRKAKKNAPLTKPITVLIRRGTYRLEKPIEFTPQDSGAANCPITYAAYPGEKVVLSGGRPITGWTKTQPPGGLKPPGGSSLWSAKVADVKAGKWYFHQLFVNGRRMQRAQTPNSEFEYLRTAGPIEPLGDREKARRDQKTKVGFRYKEGDIRKWDNLDDVNLIVYHAWTASFHWIAELDEKERIVRYTAPSGWPTAWWEKEQRYRVENCFEALDAPGEWYLNRKTGVLYLIPLRGGDPNNAEVVAPVLRHLVLFTGEPQLGLWVEHIRLKDISFQHADWFVKDKGPADGQAGVQFLKGAVHGVGALHCEMDNCEISHIGEYAVWLALGCKHNVVRHCHIHDMGGGGVVIGETSRPSNAPDAAPGDAEHNTVDNCFIHDGGNVWREGIGVIILRSSHNTVTHNDVCDFYYSGMSVGWNWGYAPSSAHHNVLEHNHIHHLGFGVLSDMGGIYTLGVSPGTRLCHNLIHDVYSYTYGGWGLYTDEGSTTILMENNIVYNTKSGGFHQHYGKENILRNNIFAYCREGQIKRSREEEHSSFTFERNIVYCDNEEMLGGNWGNNNYTMDSNCYWNEAGTAVEFAGEDLAEWQARGHDKNSIIADPKFVNAKKYDFRLKPDSPAFKLGFKQIDMSKVGLYGEKEWMDLPKGVTHRSVAHVPPVTPKLKEINDGFETTAVGDPPRLAGVSGEDKGASIRVTDEVAAAGKHSLKITDAPGLTHTWQPLLSYSLHLNRGMVRQSFDLRREEGAFLYFEWRESSKPYRVGPSVHIAENGDLKVRGRDDVLLNLPVGKWVHFEVLCELGAKAGTYDLAVAVAGEKPRVFEKLPNGTADWRKLRWLGFSSLANKKTVFYLDNIKIGQAAGR
ncbi:MAG: right-handed parallel beta-helix repeat-containing protein [Planctomycetota bacterium]